MNSWGEVFGFDFGPDVRHEYRGVTRGPLDCRVGFRYRFFGAGFCASAEPAADFDGELVRPSRRTFEAAEAADGEVTFFGAT